jgi:hypothetical protein
MIETPESAPQSQNKIFLFWMRIHVIHTLIRQQLLIKELFNMNDHSSAVAYSYASISSVQCKKFFMNFKKAVPLLFFLAVAPFIHSDAKAEVCFSSDILKICIPWISPPEKIMHRH